jgi:hypothetical protein
MIDRIYKYLIIFLMILKHLPVSGRNVNMVDGDTDIILAQ